MFDKVLVANRGEIACRIVKTARRMGVRTVAVYSAADAEARHVRVADEAVLIGPAPAKESYLVIDKIIAAAKQTGAQAIHPGYGFLSENEDFARACADAGLVFIGPPVAAIRAMGSKAQAKTLMGAAKVPLVPGYHGDDQDPPRLAREAAATGFPVLIKAVAGGGGKGMRLVERAADFDAALASCKREAAASFGDDNVLIEKYVIRPRHIEIQVFGDGFGDCVSLFERDCSVQRRHQKVLEEAPAPGMSAARRRQMGEAAVAAAKAVNYVGAGTVEFIVSSDDAFYFMEMNTRLQVEHPVTEMITGLDLVEWQLRIASGERLPLTQEQLHFDGHALEARVYAEDPDKGFLPATGKLIHLDLPQESRHVRVDAGVEEGDAISTFYDPMIAKLIVWDHDRPRALARMRQALADFHAAGVANNIDFLSRLVASPAFSAADLDTGLIERERALLFPLAERPPREVFAIAALAETLREERQACAAAERAADPRSPWRARDGWRLNAPASRVIVLQGGDDRETVTVVRKDDCFRLMIADWVGVGSGAINARGALRCELNGVRKLASVVDAGAIRHVFLGGQSWALELVEPITFTGEGAGADGGLVAPMPGRVIAVLVEAGARVEKGAPLMILEAMKMEHTITAPAAGRVATYRFSVGDQVAHGVALLDFEPDEV